VQARGLSPPSRSYVELYGQVPREFLRSTHNHAAFDGLATEQLQTKMRGDATGRMRIIVATTLAQTKAARQAAQAMA
jgi:hypothetical protein